MSDQTLNGSTVSAATPATPKRKRTRKTTDDSTASATVQSRGVWDDVLSPESRGVLHKGTARQLTTAWIPGLAFSRKEFAELLREFDALLPVSGSGKETQDIARRGEMDSVELAEYFGREDN